MWNRLDVCLNVQTWPSLKKQKNGHIVSTEVWGGRRDVSWCFGGLLLCSFTALIILFVNTSKCERVCVCVGLGNW